MGRASNLERKGSQKKFISSIFVLPLTVFSISLMSVYFYLAASISGACQKLNANFSKSKPTDFLTCSLKTFELSLPTPE